MSACDQYASSAPVNTASPIIPAGSDPPLRFIINPLLRQRNCVHKDKTPGSVNDSAMRVLISLTGIEYITFFSQLARQVWGRELDVYGFAHSLRWVREAMDTGLPRDRILYISEHRQARLRDPIDINYLRRAERQYGLPTLWPLVVAERLLAGKDHGVALKTLEIELRLITEFLDRVRPEVILIEGIAGMSTYIIWSWAQRHGVRVIIPYHPRISGRFVVIDGPYDQWKATEQRFDENRRRGLSPEDRANTEAMRRDYIEREVQPSYVTASFAQHNPPRLLNDARRGIRYVYKYVRHRGWRDYTTRSPWDYATDQLTRQIRILVHRMRPLYEWPVEGEPYVVYPLQVYPESAVSVWAPFFTNQITLIEGIARSLPIHYRLYVKEHIGAWYSRPLGFYRELRRIPNVRLISPFAKAHPLIRGASAVTTISSTMGFEALLYGKPVVTFGRVFYNACPLVHHITAPDALPALMQALLDRYEPDHEMLLQFLAAVLATTYRGEVDPYMPAFLDPGNVTAIAAGVRRELGLDAARFSPVETLERLER